MSVQSGRRMDIPQSRVIDNLPGSRFTAAGGLLFAAAYMVHPSSF